VPPSPEQPPKSLGKIGLILFFCICAFCNTRSFFLSAPQRVELSDEAKQKILQSQDFAQFFDHAARIIEKAICEEDYAFDYGAIKDDGEG